MTSPHLYRVLHRKGAIDTDTLLVLEDWLEQPQRYQLPPPLLLVLLETAQPGAEAGRIERRRGWSARSLKTVLKVVAACLQEPTLHRVRAPAAAPSEDLRETLDWVTAARAADWVQWVERYRLTHAEARVFQLLHQVVGQTVTEERLMVALYFDRIDDAPGNGVLKVHISKMRRKLAGHGWRVENVWGVGYRLERCDQVTAGPGRSDAPPTAAQACV